VDYHLTQDDFAEQLRLRVGFLRRSAEAFDRGLEDEALRLALEIRVLFHDTPNGSSKSLLGQLGEKAGLRLLDSAAPIIPDNLVPTPGLPIGQLSATEAKWVAPLGNRHRTPTKKPFGPWWTEPVTKDDRGKLFSRSDYVLNIANKQAAHVDPVLDGVWTALLKDNTLGWTVTSPMSENLAMLSPVPACVRQIAYEVDETLKDQLGHLL
jgi:hypothetical protein